MNNKPTRFYHPADTSQPAFSSETATLQCAGRKFARRHWLAKIMRAALLLSLLASAQPALATHQIEQVGTIIKNTAKATSISISTPTGLNRVNDELWIITLAAKGNKAMSESGTSAWTRVAPTLTSNNGKHAKLAIFARIVDGNEAASYTFAIGEDKEAAIALMRFSGVKTSGAILGGAIQSPYTASNTTGDSSASPTAPASTTSTSVAEEMVLRILSQKDQDVLRATDTIAPPAGYAEFVDLNYQENGDINGKAKITLGVAGLNQASVGATPAVDFTSEKAKEYVTFTMALIPAPQATVTIDKKRDTGQATTIDPGETANYSIVIANTEVSPSTLSANNVDVTDVLPILFAYVPGSTVFSYSGCTETPASVEPFVDDHENHNELEWHDVDWNLNPGCTLTIKFQTLTAINTAAGTYNNAVSATGSNLATIEDDGIAQTDEDITVRGVDLQLTKVVDDSVPNESNIITYVVTAYNDGPGAATTVVVNDPLPANLTLISQDTTTGTYVPGTGVWTIGSMASAASATLTITASVDASMGATVEAALISNTASIDGDQNDTNPLNDSATADITKCQISHVQNKVSVTLTENDKDDSDNAYNLCTQVVNSDYGDAPVSYGVASHHVLNTPLLHLGDLPPDRETGPVGSADALGDNDTDSDDEDGASFRSPGGTNHSIFADVVVKNNTNGQVTVCGWLDVPVDGVFNAADGQCQTTSLANPTLIFQWSNLPTDTSYDTFARFRVTSASLQTTDARGNTKPDGEVEDYPISFDFSPTAVTIGSVNLEPVRVADFLAELGTAQMSAPELLALLEAWDPDAAALLVNADARTILDALTYFLDADGDGQVALLRWDTLEERGTIGFYVQRQDQNGSWVTVNNVMLPGLITAPMGGEYILADPAALPGQVYQYQLIEQEANGNTRFYGPYSVEMLE